jgi:3-oxoacyl-[acyl-carrier-protein] synthase II
VLFDRKNGGPVLRRRVVVTGAGIFTGLGQGWNANDEGFRTGRRAFRPVSLFDVSRHRAKFAAEVDLNDDLPEIALSRRQYDRIDRAGKLLLIAATEAWRQAGWNGVAHLPVVLGTTSAGMNLGQAYYRQTIDPRGSNLKQASRLTYYVAQRQVMDLAEAFRFEGPSTIIANACAAGANAIGEAFRWVQRGRADRVLAGGYDALSELVFSGFDSLQALTPTLCKPFDAARDGLSLGEGAAVVTLETLESAQSRGAEILGEIAGYGAGTDIHHLTQPHPEGKAARACMDAACTEAGIDPEQVGYINAHGTGTVLNDASEAAAINGWAGPSAGAMRVSSTKAGIGHLLGAAGAVEFVACLMALRGQWLPPMKTLDTIDPAVRFNLVTETAPASLEYALTNSFGFGGANASLLVRRWN